MGGRRALLPILVLWTVAIHVAGPQIGRAALFSQLEIDTERFQWTQLVFEAKRFLVSVNVDARIDSVATPEAERSWLVPPRGEALPAPPPETRYLPVDLTIDPLFRSPVRLSTQVWFDPRDATALARTRLSRGEDDYEKRYRFTSEGVYRWARSK